MRLSLFLYCAPLLDKPIVFLFFFKNQYSQISQIMLKSLNFEILLIQTDLKLLHLFHQSIFLLNDIYELRFCLSQLILQSDSLVLKVRVNLLDFYHRRVYLLQLWAKLKLLLNLVLFLFLVIHYFLLQVIQKSWILLTAILKPLFLNC